MRSLLNVQSSSSELTTLLRQKSQQTHYYFRIAIKLAKTHQNLLLQF